MREPTLGRRTWRFRMPVWGSAASVTTTTRSTRLSGRSWIASAAAELCRDEEDRVLGRVEADAEALMISEAMLAWEEREHE